MQPGTISGYCQAFNRGLKYLVAQDVDAEESLAYVRELTNTYQKQATKGHQSWQQLSRANKWLHWEQVLEVMKAQREVYESQIKPELRAFESQRYAALLLYCAVPPARGEVYRTLKIRINSEPAETSGSENILHYGREQMFVLELGKFKNSKHMGVQNIDISNIEFLTSHLHDYINRDRPILLKDSIDHSFLFMVGEEYFELEHY